MKKLFLLFAALCCMMVAGAQSYGPEDDNETLMEYKDACIDEIEACLWPDDPNFEQVVYQARDDIMDATSKEQVTQIRDLAMAKLDALTQIEAYKEDKTFTKEEETWLNDFTSTICEAQDIYTVNMARDNALGIYALRDIKSQAISDINAALQLDTASSTLISSVVTDDIEAIKSANTAEAVNVRKAEAIWKLTTAQQLYQAIKTDILGTLATPQNGPSFEVTDQNDKVIRLYNPKHAKLIEENK